MGDQRLPISDPSNLDSAEAKSERSPKSEKLLDIGKGQPWARRSPVPGHSAQRRYKEPGYNDIGVPGSQEIILAGRGLDQRTDLVNARADDSQWLTTRSKPPGPHLSSSDGDVMKSAELYSSGVADKHSRKCEKIKQRAPLRKRKTSSKRQQNVVKAVTNMVQVKSEVPESEMYASGCNILPRGAGISLHIPPPAQEPHSAEAYVNMPVQVKSDVQESEPYTTECNALPGAAEATPLARVAQDIPVYIPPPVLEPTYCTISNRDILPCTMVVASVETTDTSHSAQIIQLSARFLVDDDEGFSQYVRPTRFINPPISSTTGMTVRKDRMQGEQFLLLVDENEVECSDIATAIDGFLAWASTRAPYCIVFHRATGLNCRSFLLAVESTNRLNDLQGSCHGFVDSLPLLQDYISDVDSHSISSLYTHITDEPYLGRDAIADTAALQRILAETDTTSPGCLQPYTMTLESTVVRHAYLRDRNKRLPVLRNRLVCPRVITLHMAEKIAGSGLCYRHLEAVYRQNGEDGLRALLQDCTEAGKPRVTDTERILNALCQHFREEV